VKGIRHSGKLGLMTAVKTMIGAVHGDMDHYEESPYAGGEGDPESSKEAITDCLPVRAGHRLALTACGNLGTSYRRSCSLGCESGLKVCRPTVP
jgi:hypothetical protein